MPGLLLGDGRDQDESPPQGPGSDGWADPHIDREECAEVGESGRGFFWVWRVRKGFPEEGPLGLDFGEQEVP